MLEFSILPRGDIHESNIISSVQNIYKERGESVAMEFFTKKRIAAAGAVLAAVIILLIARVVLQNTAPETWNIVCKIENVPLTGEVIEVGGTMYYVGDDPRAIRVFTSSDGCIWSEIESPTAGRDIWSCSASLFKTPDGNLGIAWEETDPDIHKKPRSISFWSLFDGKKWSEPLILFTRDEYCLMDDALMLDNGALLLLWDEPLFQYTQVGDRVIRGSGCDVTYRAYIDTDTNEQLIERVIEPENPSSCSTNGYAFVDDGERIWCIFSYGWRTYSVYKSASEDGRKWTQPEPFKFPDLGHRRLFLTPKGEFGVVGFKFREKTLYLFTSTNWKHWSKELLIRTEGPIEYCQITESHNGTLWGYVDTEEGMFLILPSQGAAHSYYTT